MTLMRGKQVRPTAVGRGAARRASPRSGSAFAAAAALVRTQTLRNGLRILVWPDHHIPSVALQLWVRAGSRNEGAGTSGLAHFFEHMMFNGTARHPQGDFDRLLEAQGGSNNAFTSHDVTVYLDWFPSAALALVLELESDRFAHLAFSPTVVENERSVVYSERRLRVEDSNAALLDEQVQATAFLAHPYRIPTIGWPSDIQSWSMTDLKSFYQRHYAPNNCTLIVVGAVEPARVFALARRYFGPIPRRDPPRPVLTREPAQIGERRVVLERPGQNALVQYAYPAIRAADPRAPALNLLQTILSGGNASRLHRSLVETQKRAVAISAGWPEGFDPHLFTIHATLAAGASVPEFELALQSELARLVSDGVTDAELKRAKNIAAADFWRAASTIDGKARLLGEYAVLHGDHAQLFTAPRAYERVSLREVAQVAREIFDPAKRTVGILKPLGNGEAR